MDTKRFKSPEYKRKIQAVRSYKRAVMPLPDTAAAKFFSKIGLGSLLRQILLALFLAALVYLIYFADFLVIKDANISGANQAKAQRINEILDEYKQGFWFIFPQKNALFFSPQNFSKYLLAKDFEISSAKVSKKLWRHVSISVVTRVPVYVLVNKDKLFILSSDGSISRLAESADKEKLPIVIDNVDDNITLGEVLLNQTKYGFLAHMSENFYRRTALHIENFEINGKSSNDLVIAVKDGAKFYFDSTTDPEKYLSRVMSLFSSLTPEQQKRLAYVDLRYDPKAYVCYKNDKCNQKPESINPEAAMPNVNITNGANKLPIERTPPVQNAKPDIKKEKPR